MTCLEALADNNYMYEPFIRAIESEGLTPPDKIIADVKKHRFDSDGQGKKKREVCFFSRRTVFRLFHLLQKRNFLDVE